MSLSVELDQLIYVYVFSKKTNYALCSRTTRMMLLNNETNLELFDFTSIEKFKNYVNIILHYN